MYGNPGSSRGPMASTNNTSSINSTLRKPGTTTIPTTTSGGTTSSSSSTTTTGGTTTTGASKFVISSRPTGNVSVNPSLPRTTVPSSSSATTTSSWSLPATPTTTSMTSTTNATNSYLNNGGLSRTGTTTTSNYNTSSSTTGSSTSSAASAYVNSNNRSVLPSTSTTSVPSTTSGGKANPPNLSSTVSSSSSVRPPYTSSSSSSATTGGTNRLTKLPSSSSMNTNTTGSTSQTGKRPSSQGSTVSSSRSSVAESSNTGSKSNTGGSSLSSSSSSSSSSSNHKLVKKELLKFSLKDLIMSTTVGTGTFGRVRVVQYKPTRTWYALKILKKSEIIRLRQVEHIQSEVKILSQVSHPFIVNMLGFLTDEKRLYMLFDYVPGGELFSHLRRIGKFTNDAARFYASEIVLAFEYLHNFNIVYRDLKPENLLLTNKGHVKITDFGFAKVVDDRTYTLCGTPEYLAPEIIQSKGHNKGADWWAIGILIYEMLAGYPPFFDETPYGIYQKILDGKIEWPTHFSTEAKDLIKKLLTAERTRRLGCLFNGAKDIKDHAWFNKLNWENVYNCAVPAPLVPPVKDANDTSNFDDYPDSDGDTAGRLSSKEAAEFADLDKF